MRWMVVIGFAALAGCGADGEPLRPEAAAVRTTIGVGSDGVTSSTQVTTRVGPVSIGVGL